MISISFAQLSATLGWLWPCSASGAPEVTRGRNTGVVGFGVGLGGFSGDVFYCFFFLFFLPYMVLRVLRIFKGYVTFIFIFEKDRALLTILGLLVNVVDRFFWVDLPWLEELAKTFFSPNSVSTLWGSYGKGKEWCP